MLRSHSHCISKQAAAAGTEAAVSPHADTSSAAAHLQACDQSAHGDRVAPDRPAAADGERDRRVRGAVHLAVEAHAEAQDEGEARVGEEGTCDRLDGAV